MASSFKLTKQNFKRIKTMYEQIGVFQCPKCHKPFKLGDEIVRVGRFSGRYFHKKCLETMRI